MIKFRPNALNSHEIDYPRIAGENLNEVFDRILTESGKDDSKLREYFEILVDGYIIERELWEFTIPHDSSSVLIAITPKGGDFGRILGQIAVIAAVMIATAATGGASAGAVGAEWGFWSAFGVRVGAAIGTQLLVSALIPPPDTGIGGTGATYDYADSQMYSITGQSNRVKKYGTVPRLYGRHQIFPVVAANAYTELIADENGEIIQNFHAIYDFGYGPLNVEELKIGDTSFNEYFNAYYRLVDPNKPDPVINVTTNLTIDATAKTITRSTGDFTENLKDGYYLQLGGFATTENNKLVRVVTVDNATQVTYSDVDSVLVDETGVGTSYQGIYPWDQALNKEFVYYKGDVNQADVSVALNVNQNDPGALPSEYEATRSADDSGNGDKQDITLLLAFPEGLTTFATNGNRADRTVELDIQYADVGTEDWKAFNSETDSESWSAVGDITGVSSKTVPMYPSVRNANTNTTYNNYSTLSSKEIPPNEAYGTLGVLFAEKISWGDYVPIFYYVTYGLAKGATQFVSSRYINVNDHISHGGNIVGKIQTRDVIDATYFRYTLNTGLPYAITMFSDYFKTRDGLPNLTSYHNDTVSIPDIFDIENSTSGVVTITGNSAEVVYGSVKFTPLSTNQIKIRVTRTRSYNGHTFTIRDKMVWGSITTRFDREPIVTENRHCFLEVKIKATDQLNGSVSNLSAVCESIIPVFNGTEWILEATTNPAWVFADLLTGSPNKRALSKTRLDTDSILDWATFCEEVPTPPPGATFERSRFECNFVLDYNATLQTVIGQVTTSAQASLNVINGRYGVLVDKLKTVPVQIFSPRNCVSFTSSRTYSELPHAFKVKYIDGNDDWSIREAIVYADGYDAVTATTFEEFNTFACSNEEQAWRYGRYMLAQAKLRQENTTLTVDFENLVCTRGDYVLLQYDVMKAGGRPARVKSVAGSNVEVDDGLVDGGGSYGYTFRNSNTGAIVTDTMTITSTTNMTVDGVVPGVGDLLIWGEVDAITIDCIVKSIMPNADLSAQITLVEKADAIYTAESTDTLPDYDPQISTSIDTEVAPPSEVTNLLVDDNTWMCRNGAYSYFVDLDWGSPEGGVVESYEIYVNKGNGYELTDYSTVTSYRYFANEDYLDIEHSFKVIGVASTGTKLTLGEVGFVNATPLLKTAYPTNVDGLFANILNETLQLDWRLVSDCDIDYYLIRYSPKLSATWENSIPLQVVDRNTSLCSVQARTGSYYIKAVDWNGNESEIAASIVTSIPNLVNLNVIEETNDFPTVTGVKDQVIKIGDALILQEEVASQYYSDGYYYYANFLDVGEIYEVRLSSLIDAEGYSEDDVMANWLTLDAVTFMTTARVSEWDVETQYRSTETFNVMADWVSLDVIDPISEGSPDQWTAWRKFTIGDFTGRIFQFRLRLVSNLPSVTPRVFDGIIKADMPDRTISFDNIVAPIAGYSVVYDPNFAGPGTTPNIQVTQDAAQQGDYYVLSNKTLAGFTINFYDKNNVAVSRQFDTAIRGYGRKQTVIL